MRWKAVLIWQEIVISVKAKIMENVVDTKPKKMSLSRVHPLIGEGAILRGMGILMWPPEVGGNADQSDKDSIPGCENESLHRMRMQDPSVGLS